MRILVLAVLLSGPLYAPAQVPRVALHAVRFVPKETRVYSGQFFREVVADESAIREVYEASFLPPVRTPPALGRIIGEIQHTCPVAAAYAYVDRREPIGSPFACLERALTERAPEIAKTLRAADIDLFVYVAWGYFPDEIRKPWHSAGLRYDACEARAQTFAITSDGVFRTKTVPSTRGDRDTATDGSICQWINFDAHTTPQGESVSTHLAEYLADVGLAPATASTPRATAPRESRNDCEKEGCSITVRIIKDNGLPCAHCPVLFTWTGMGFGTGGDAPRQTDARGYVTFDPPERYLATIATIVNKTGLVLPLRFNVDTLGGTTLTIRTTYTGE